MTSTFYDFNENPFSYDAALIKTSQTEWITLTDNTELDEYTTTWKYNRILNSEKITEIMECIRYRKFMDSFLYFFVDNNGKFVCFDGNHRREALILLAKQNIIIKCMCYIYHFDDDQQVAKQFQTINKNTPIPDIYMDILSDDTIVKRDIIEEVFNKYKSKYSQCYSLSNKPRRPNFNENMFYDLCHKIEFNSKKTLIQRLRHINEANKTRDLSYTPTILQKCEKYNLFLFV